jgi:acetylornithine deacetylase
VETGLEAAKQAVREYVAAHEDAVIALTEELVAAPSPNLPGDETAPAAVIRAWAERYGLPSPVEFAKEPHRPNLIIRIDGAKPGPHLGICGHLDTKPVGDAADEWRTDPMVATTIGDRMYGLGSTDMKGACAAMLIAGAAFASVSDQLAGSLSLIYTADEEYGSTYGARYLTDIGAIDADAIILGEPSGVKDEWDAIRTVSRGVCGFRVVVSGTQTHSSISDVLPTVSAVEAMAKLITGFRREFKPRYPEHPLCPLGPTINIGVKAFGGYGYGVIAGDAEFWTDVRLVPKMDRQMFQEDVIAALERVKPELGAATYEVDFNTRINWYDASEVPPDHPMVTASCRAAEAVLGTAPPLAYFPGGSDAAAFQVVGGIPTLPSFGPGQLPLAHGPNEWVSVTSLRQAAHMYALTGIEYSELSR